MSLRASCTACARLLSVWPRSSSIAWSIRPRATRRTSSGTGTLGSMLYDREDMGSRLLSVQQSRGGGRRVEPTGDDLVQQLLDRRVLAHLLLELAPQPVGGQRQHLVHQVAPAPLRQRALALDVGVVLVDLLGELVDPLAAAGL